MLGDLFRLIEFRGEFNIIWHFQALMNDSLSNLFFLKQSTVIKTSFLITDKQIFVFQISSHLLVVWDFELVDKDLLPLHFFELP